MALDSEAKRWSMLQVAGGPVPTPLINPSGSGLDSEVERLTYLNIYGGLAVADTTAPILSSGTATVTGPTTADATVDTNEDNGTLYYYASKNATESAATIKASGDNQSVTGTGTQSVSFTGLTASTDYYVHFIQDDNALNTSNVINVSFTTQAGTKGGAAQAGISRRKPQPKTQFELEPIGEINPETGELVLYNDKTTNPVIEQAVRKEAEQLQKSIKTLSSKTSEDISIINKNLEHIKIYKNKKNKLKIVNLLDLFLEEEALLLLLLANNQ